MIVDVTGTILTPGNYGKDCLGNGTDPNIECCCDECDYMQCCLDKEYPKECIVCNDSHCPRGGINWQ